MLSRVGEPSGGSVAPPQTSIDAKLAELRRDYRRDDSSRLPQDNNPSLRREPASSLRESLLKKPLGSLFSKD
jgi:hypothetical protein